MMKCAVSRLSAPGFMGHSAPKGSRAASFAGGRERIARAWRCSGPSSEGSAAARSRSSSVGCAAAGSVVASASTACSSWALASAALNTASAGSSLAWADAPAGSASAANPAEMSTAVRIRRTVPSVSSIEFLPSLRR